MKLNVVPLESERKIGVIFSDGRVLPGFSFLIAGSFQAVIFPRKIFARTAPFIRRCGAAPLRL